MKPLVLLIIDGWGVAPSGDGNAISKANLPFYLKLLTTYPHGLLKASGESVGLPRGEDGNTETGHLNIGAGRIVYQDLPRINLSIAEGSFFTNKAFNKAIYHAQQNCGKLHLLGLIGSGGVHSNLEHLLALLQLCKEKNFRNVFLHLITDGRDSPPESAFIYYEQIIQSLLTLGFGKIATIMGRYYAMDRDSRWDRTKKAYDALTKGTGEKCEDPDIIIKSSYKKGLTDEFILPTSVTEKGKPIALIQEGDGVIFFNFRIDRPRQLTKAFILDDFEGNANKSDFDPYAVRYEKKHTAVRSPGIPPFPRDSKINNLCFVTMTEYSKDFDSSLIAFPPWVIKDTLGKVLSEAGIKQLRLAESEKERFVTYYFNGQNEKPNPEEDRLIISSPLVPTYDLKPEMSIGELEEKLIENLEKDKYDVYIINIANPDMVAHTGNINATVKACERVDKFLQRTIPKILERGGTAFITADHGNAEELIDNETGGINTEHSTYPVPFIAVNGNWEWNNLQLPMGVLADIAPTILSVLKIKPSSGMTGRNLLENIID